MARDGSWAVVVKRRIRRRRRKLVYESHLYSVDLATRGGPRPVTEGHVRDSYPAHRPRRPAPGVPPLRSLLRRRPHRAPRDLDRRPRLEAAGAQGLDTGVRRHQRTRVVARRTPSGVRRRVDPPRSIVGDHPPVGSGRGAPPSCPRRPLAGSTRRLAVGRGRAPRSLVAPVRDRRRAGATPRRSPLAISSVGAVRVASERSDHRVCGRSQANVRPPAPPDGLVGRRRRRTRIGAIEATGAARRRWRCDTPAYSPDGRGWRAVGSPPTRNRWTT